MSISICHSTTGWIQFRKISYRRRHRQFRGPQRANSRKHGVRTQYKTLSILFPLKFPTLILNVVTFLNLIRCIRNIPYFLGPTSFVAPSVSQLIQKNFVWSNVNSPYYIKPNEDATQGRVSVFWNGTQRHWMSRSGCFFGRSE